MKRNLLVLVIQLMDFDSVDTDRLVSVNIDETDYISLQLKSRLLLLLHLRQLTEVRENNAARAQRKQQQQFTTTDLLKRDQCRAL